MTSTWRQWSGREGGRNGYVFGDLTRSVVKTLRTQNWKDTSGREQGDDGYQFGDITRSFIRKVSDSFCSTCSEKERDLEVGQLVVVTEHFNSDSPGSLPLATGLQGSVHRVDCDGVLVQFAGVEDAQWIWNRNCRRLETKFVHCLSCKLQWRCPDPASSICTSCKAPVTDGRLPEEFYGDIGDVWHMFFNQARCCGQRAVEKGIISAADVEEQEPFLFLGLPGLTLLELILRSLHAPEDTLVLASGAIITSKNLPEGQGSRALFRAVMAVRAELRNAAFAEEELDRLRYAVLRVEGDTTGSEIATGRSAEINRAASTFQTIATDISQLPFYRKHFLKVLEDILTE